MLYSNMMSTTQLHVMVSGVIRLRIRSISYCYSNTGVFEYMHEDLGKKTELFERLLSMFGISVILIFTDILKFTDIDIQKSHLKISVD